MKLVAHIGAPKTATTHVQMIMERNKKSIENAGYTYVGPAKIRSDPAWREFFSYYTGKAGAEVLKNARDILGHGDAVILSEEGITHDLMPSVSSGGGFGRLEASANFLEAMNADDLHVVLGVRRQDKFLASTYTHFLHRHGLAKTLEEWFLRVVDPLGLSWVSVIDYFERRFGADRLTIVPYEMSRPNMGAYVARLFEKTDIDFAGWNYDASETNPSLSVLGVGLARHVNQTVRERPAKRENVISSIIREFPASSFGRFGLDDTKIPAILGRIYGAENEAVRRRWFPEDAPNFLF